MTGIILTIDYKMKQILFSHSYFLRFDPKQWAIGQPYAPLGTLQAAAVLQQAGYEVALFDTMFAYGPDDILPWLDGARPDCLVIYDDGFNYLTKMCLTNMREAAFRMIALAKERGAQVVVSSSDSTDRYEQYLAAGADCILLGEAEMTLQELLAVWGKGETDLMQIPGLAYLHNGAVIKTAGRPVMRDLDALPLPAWELVDMEPYRERWMQRMGYFSMNMGTTRGCPFKCNWCAKPIYGNRYNSRSPQHVVKELTMLQQRYQFDHIWFCDDIFGLKPGWVKEFADLVQAAGLRFDFKIQSRVDLLLQEDNIRHLARAGCANVWMGAESGSQKILDAMDKGTTIEQIYEATALLKKNGIHPSFFIQFGYPGETKEDIRRTVQMINELLPYEIGISVSYPLPGTVFFERVKNELKEKTNWTDSDELALMFRNTYQPAFYKQLHRYVHKSYRSHLAAASLRQLLLRPLKANAASFKKAVSWVYYAPAALLAKIKLRQLEKA
jgi:anaerobic magnesium-protoporphyrin IX monomethyl ester cyclase